MDERKSLEIGQKVTLKLFEKIMNQKLRFF